MRIHLGYFTEWYRKHSISPIFNRVIMSYFDKQIFIKIKKAASKAAS